MTVTIKGTADGLVVTLGDGEWNAEFAALTDRIATSAKFFSGAQATLDVGARNLDAAEIARLWAAIERSVKAIRGAAPSTGAMHKQAA